MAVSTAELRILLTAQDSASQVLARAVGGFEGIAASATRVGSAMTRSLTLPAGLIAGGIIKEAADVEQTLDILVNQTREAGKNVVDAAMGFDDAAKRMAAFRKLAIEIGGDPLIPNINAAEAATGMTELAKAGLSVHTVLAAARPTALLAAATNIDMAQAADIASASIKQFALQGSDMENVTNMIVRGMELSRLKIGDLTVGLRQGGAAMHTLGIPMEGFISILGALVDRGVSGGVAATSLRRAISAVASPTAKATATMEKYGIEIFNAEGKFKGWADTIDMLDDKLGDLTDKEKFAAIKDIFGQEGFKSIAPLLSAAKNGSEAFQELNEAFEKGEIDAEMYQAAMDKLKESGIKFSDQLRANEKDIKASNAAVTAAAAIQKGLKGALDGLWSTLMTVAVVLGTPFLQGLNNMTQGAQGAAKAIAALAEANPKVVAMAAAFVTVVAAAGPMIWAFGRIMTLMLGMATPLGMLITLMATFAAAWTGDVNGLQLRTMNFLDTIRGGLDQMGMSWADWARDAGAAGGAVSHALSGINGLVLALQFLLAGDSVNALQEWERALDNFGRSWQLVEETVGNTISEILNRIGELTGVDVTGVTGWVDKIAALAKIDISKAAGELDALRIVLSNLSDLALGNVAKTLADIFGLKISPALSGAGNFFAVLKDLSGLAFDGVINLLAAISNVKLPAEMSSLDKLKELAAVDFVKVTAFFDALSKLTISEDVARILDNLASALSNVKIAMEGLNAGSGKFDLSDLFRINIQASDILLISAIGVAFSSTANLIAGAAAKIRLAIGLITGALQLYNDFNAGKIDRQELNKQFSELAEASRKAFDDITANQIESQKKTQEAFAAAKEAMKRETEEMPTFNAAGADAARQFDEGLRELPEQVRTTLDGAALEAQKFAQTFETTGQASAESFEGGMQNLPSLIQPIMDQIPPQFAFAANDAARQFDEGLHELPQAATGAIELVNQELETGIDPGAAEQAGSGWSEAFTNGISSILEAFSTTAFAEELSADIEAAVPQAQAAGESIGMGATEGVTTGIAPLPLAVQTAMEEANSAIQASGQAIVAGVTDVFAQVVEIATAQMAAATAAVTEGGAQQQAAMEAANTAILASSESSWTAILASVTASTTASTAAVTTGGAQMTAAMVAAGAAMVAAMASSMAALVAAATAGASAAVAAVNAQVGPAGAAGAAVGSAIVSGMSGAISAGAGRVAAAAASMVTQAIGAARAAAGAESPSKETYNLGADFVDGLTNALTDKSGEPAGALQGIVDDLIASFGDLTTAQQDIGDVESRLADNRERYARDELSRSKQIQGVLTAELHLRESLANLALIALPGQQAIARSERELANIKKGSIEDQRALLAIDQKDNALRQQELQLNRMLNQAETGAPRDAKTGRRKDTQDIADTKAALEMIRAQREELRLQSDEIALRNEAMSFTTQQQLITERNAIEAMEDQKFALSQQLEQVNALDAVWRAHEATIKGAQQNQIDDSQRAINAMKDQAAITPEVFEAGISVITQLRDQGSLTQAQFEKFRNMLQALRGDLIAVGQGAPPIAAVGTAIDVAGTQAVATGRDMATAEAQVIAFAQSGARVGEMFATAGVQGMETFVANASEVGNRAAIQIINTLQAQQGALFNAGYALGVAVGDGLAIGIIESGQRAIDAAIQVANAVIAAMRGPEGFDAGSPSRKSYFIGVDVMAGLQEGLMSASVDNAVKQRIRDYIEVAERYRKILPEAADNEMKIINTRMRQAQALLEGLDLEFRVRDAQRAAEDIRRGGLATQLAVLRIEERREKLHLEELQFANQLRDANKAVQATQRAISDTERGSITTQITLINLEQQRQMIQVDQLALTRDIVDANRLVSETTKAIAEIESGGLAGKIRALDIDRQQALISRERIGIERRLAQYTQADLEASMDRFQKQGLTIVDTNDPAQREINNLHNRLALLDLQNQALDDETELQQLNARITSYSLRVQLLYQEKIVEGLQDQNDEMSQASDELGRQVDLLRLVGQLSSTNLRIQLIFQEAALVAAQDHQDAITAASEEMQRQIDLINTRTNLESFEAQARLIFLEEEHRAQTRLVDDLDKQYEALNRQKQVYDVLLRAVDYLHDHLIDIGIIKDPFEREEPEETAERLARSSAGSGASSRLSGTGSSASRDTAAARASAEADTIIGNAERALARLTPIITGVKAAGIDAVKAVDAQVGRTLVTLTGLNSTNFRVSVDDQTIREATTAADQLETTATGISQNLYTVNIGGQQIKLSELQALGLRAALQGTTEPVDIVVNGQAISLSSEGVATLQGDLNYLNTIRPTLSIEDQALQDADRSITTVVTSLDTLDTTIANPVVDPLVERAEVDSLIETVVTPHILPVEGQFDPTDTLALIDTTLLPRVLTIDDELNRTDFDALLGETSMQHLMPIDDLLDRSETDALIEFALETHDVILDDVLDRDELDEAIDFAETVHDMQLDDVLDRSELDEAVEYALEEHELTLNDILDREELDQAIEDALAENVLTIVNELDRDDLDTALEELDEDYELAVQVAVDAGDLDEVLDDIQKDYEIEVEVNFEENGRAGGGPVGSGRAYLVGERGREMFIPNTAGFIIPNNITDHILDSSKARQMLAGHGMGELNLSMPVAAVSNKNTINNYNISYTALNQKQQGYSDISRIVRDAAMMSRT